MKASNGTSNRTAQAAGPARNADSSSSTAERFTLVGPSLLLDERLHAYRRDIADIALAGQLFAPHYARPVMRRCASESAVRAAPESTSEIVSELFEGDEFAVLEFSGAWAWGYRRANHHVGYVPVGDLAIV